MLRYNITTELFLKELNGRSEISYTDNLPAFLQKIADESVTFLGLNKEMLTYSVTIKTGDRNQRIFFPKESSVGRIIYNFGPDDAFTYGKNKRRGEYQETGQEMLFYQNGKLISDSDIEIILPGKPGRFLLNTKGVKHYAIRKPNHLSLCMVISLHDNPNYIPPEEQRVELYDSGPISLVEHEAPKFSNDGIIKRI
jgi:hypothetical protein